MGHTIYKREVLSKSSDASHEFINCINPLPSNRRLQLTAFGARDRAFLTELRRASAAAEAQHDGLTAIPPLHPARPLRNRVFIPD